MKITNRLLQSIFLVAFISLSSSAQTAEDGEKLFNANCVSCHAINEKIVGPALKDVHTRREEKWLVSWIKNSQKMIKSGDPIATQLNTEYNGLVMTSFEQLSDNQIKSIIEYVKAESTKPAAAAVASGTNTPTAAPVEVSATMRGKINWLIIINVTLLFIVLYFVVEVLQKLGEIQGKAIINWSKTNGILMLVFLIVGLAATFWEFYAHSKLTVYVDEPASEHGIVYDNMLMITLVLTGVVFLITQILLFWYSYRYRETKTSKALYYADNHKLELLWTAIPAIVLTVLVVRGLKVWNEIMYTKNDEAVNIELFAYQFGWDARYAGTDNKLGAADFRQIGVVNAFGVNPYTDQTAKDDIVTKELYLPVNKTVSLKFRAKDVIHSALLPHFRAQMNVVPGLPTQFTFKPTITTAEMRKMKNDPKFDYVLLCNKICGGAHYRMKMKVVVVSESDYNQWVATQSKLIEVSTKPEDIQPTSPQAVIIENNDKTLASK